MIEKHIYNQLIQSVAEFYLRYPEKAKQMENSPFKQNFERLVSRILTLESSICVMRRTAALTGLHVVNLGIFHNQTVAEFNMYFGEWPDPNKDIDF